MTFRDYRDAKIASLTAEVGELRERERRREAKPRPPKPPGLLRRVWYVARSTPGDLWVLWITIALCVTLVVAVLLAAFWPPDITEGVVTGKRHRNAWVQVVTNGQTTSTIYHPESWTVTIAQGEATETFSVDRQTWRELERGEWYCAQGCEGAEER